MAELNIYQAMAKISLEVEAIGKNKVNELQKYKFRGIDDLYNTLHGLYAKYGVTITSEPINSSREERTTKSGGLLIYSIIDYKFTLYATDGTFIITTVKGEGMDSSDKSSNKAFSAALKYALMSMHLIPTEDLTDADKETPEPEPKSRKFYEELRQIIKENGVEKVKDALPKLNELTGIKYSTFPTDEKECQNAINQILIKKNG